MSSFVELSCVLLDILFISDKGKNEEILLSIFIFSKGIFNSSFKEFIRFVILYNIFCLILLKFDKIKSFSSLLLKESKILLLLIISSKLLSWFKLIISFIFSVVSALLIIFSSSNCFFKILL